MVQFLLVDLPEMTPFVQMNHSPLAPKGVWPKIKTLVYEQTERMFTRSKNGRIFANVLEALPNIKPSILNFNTDRVIIGAKEDIDQIQAPKIIQALKQLMPWRKGPFEIFGTFVDSEWNSALKWRRLKDHIKPLHRRKILDIGCSNGYYMFRMAALKPMLIFGIEPYLLFYTQYLLLQRYAKIRQFFYLPITLEELPPCRAFFDTVFCMGILYHQRSPLDTLSKIHAQMTPGGELILETLIIEGAAETSLFPAKRYAKMNNVYFIPTVACLTHWLRRTGFINIRCISVAKTTASEQRKTDWIASHSLDSFLDPANPHLTIEGYPAPVRAIVLAETR
jgi:tRNA (mo5U34)-methyltransferase